MNKAQQFVERHKNEFGTHDGLPSEFFREAMYNAIRPRDTVGIVTPHGNILCGKVVMSGPAGWVINTGGPHGTPEIAGPENTVYVSGTKINGAKIWFAGR